MLRIIKKLLGRPLRRAFRPERFGGLATGLLLVGAGVGAQAAEPTVKESAERLEYQVKAGFLFNFAKFVQWPTNMSVATNEFRIGVIGSSNVCTILDAALTDKPLESRVIRISAVTTTNDAARCQMLFISRSASETEKNIWLNVSSQPVLTVGETAGFATQGGCINLTQHKQSIRLEINLKAVDQAGLKISAKLASMATLVETEKTQ